MNKKILTSAILSIVMLASIPAAVFADTSSAAKKQQQQQDQKKGKTQKSNVKQAQYDRFNRDRNREERNREREYYRRDRERRDRGMLMVTLTTPAFSRNQDVTLRGRAFGSNRVRVFVNGRFIGSTPVGGDGRYEKAVRLRKGENRIRVSVTRGSTTRTVVKIIRVR